MKALILAAGRGSRIQCVHGEHPKCLIRIDEERTILDQQIENLLATGVSRFGIVVGYEKNEIINHIQARYRAISSRFHFISNPRFAYTNNIYSLWQARDWLKSGSFICLNADVVFDGQILTPVLYSPSPITMIVDPEWRDETMKVIVRGQRIVRMSKGISREEFSGTYLGITAFSAGINERFFRVVESLVQAGRVNDFFNTAVQRLADEGVHVGPSPTWGLPWAEIDEPGDLDFAREQVFPKLRKLQIAA